MNNINIRNSSFITFKKTILLFLVGSSVLIHPMAFADAQDTFNFIAGITSRYDDNLFRTVNNEESDRSTGFYAGVRLDKQYSLQRFTAEATITRNKYSKNTFLDYDAKAFNLAWFWALTPRLTGKVSADRSETLNDFFFTQNRIQNIRTTQNQAFLADYNPGGGWHALAGISRSTNKNSQTFNQDASFSRNGVDFGVKYLFPSNSSITLMNHIRKGKFDDRQINPVSQFDTGFKQKESELILDWVLTAKSRVNVTTGYIRHESEDFSSRDFSGFQGSLGYNWSPTAKISVGFNTSSRLSQFQTDTDSYTRTNTLSINPRYAVTPKISVTSSLSMSEQKFLGRGPGTSTQNRIDDRNSLSLGIQWTPTLNSSIGITLQREELDSTENIDYKNNSVTVLGNLLF